MTLVCFAVKAEAQPFQQLARSRSQVKTLLTGIGSHNAERAIRTALNRQKPNAVLSCGFAGGLRPALATGTVVFTADKETGWEPTLLAAGAQCARFHCAEGVATTAEQKRALWQATGADAVEMESAAIHAICRERGIPCATVRVISDTANEDLPLDFNQLSKPEMSLDYGKLAWAIARSPGKIGALLKLQKRTRFAAEQLAVILGKIIW